MRSLRGTSELIFSPYASLGPVGKIIYLLCLYVSVCLIIRLWLCRRKDPFGKKLFWSVVLLVPLAGWVFYGALYDPLPPK